MDVHNLHSVQTDYQGEMIFFGSYGSNGVMLIVQNLHMSNVGDLRKSLQQVFGPVRLESSIQANPFAKQATTTISLRIYLDDPEDIEKPEFVLEYIKPYFNKALELHEWPVPTKE